MRRSVFIIAAVLIAAFSFSPAVAATVDVSYDLGYTIKGKERQYPGNWTVDNSMYTAVFDVTIDGQSGYTGYCVDIFHNAGDGQFDVISFNDLSEKYKMAAYLMDNYAFGLGDDLDSYSQDAVITALSSAIWSVTQYGTDWWGREYSQFEFLYSNHEKSAVSNLYKTMMDDVLSADISSYQFQKDYSVLTNDKLQNLIVATDKSVATPEPATMVLLGSALGLGAFVRRRRSAIKA